jgi:hypothetical protein
VYNQEGATFEFAVYGSNTNPGGYGDPSTTKKHGAVPLGTERFIRQWVYEYGYRWAALFAFAITDNTYTAGVWSPDSVGSCPYANW